MDKIIALICKEAWSRPGNDWVKNLTVVKLEIDNKLGEVMATIRESERLEELDKRLQKGDSDDSGIKQP